MPKKLFLLLKSRSKSFKKRLLIALAMTAEVMTPLPRVRRRSSLPRDLELILRPLVLVEAARLKKPQRKSPKKTPPVMMIQMTLLHPRKSKNLPLKR